MTKLRGQTKNDINGMRQMAMNLIRSYPYNFLIVQTNKYRRKWLFIPFPFPLRLYLISI